MILIETVLGNIRDREWAERLSSANTDLLEIDQWEAQKNRFRKRTAGGTQPGCHDLGYWRSVAPTQLAWLKRVLA